MATKTAALSPPSTQTSERTSKSITRTHWLIGLVAVLLLTAVFAAVNWHWLQANVVTYGWDRLDHLITSLVYRNTLASLNPRSLLAALAYSDYYPPLVHYGAALLYRLFGVDEDVAVMVNVAYLAVLLGSTWWIGNRLRGAGGGMLTGILAAALLGLFPMIFAMSRYFYLDFALTALVALSMALLLASERFSRRLPSLLFGLGLGLAFLVKWTAAAFVVGPLLYVIWRSGALVYAWRNPRRLLPHWGRLALALVLGIAFFLGWFALAPDVVATLRLGWALALPLGLLLGGVLYGTVLRQPPSSGMAGTASEPGEVRPAIPDGQPPAAHALANLLSAGVIAAFVAALWYLTNIEFIDYFLFTAYGKEDQPFYAFGKYLREVTVEQLGPWFALVFVAVAAVWLFQQRHRWRRLLPDLGDTGWVLLLWVLVPYFIFSFRVTLAHSRFVLPFLPPFALWMAAGLLLWRPAWLRIAAIVGVLAVGIGQYALISFDELAPYRSAFTLSLPGQAQPTPGNLLAHGFFIQYPTSGVTDPGYALAPQVLTTVDAARQQAGRETIALGLLVNSYQLHEKHFLYQIYQHFPQVRLRELARNWNGRPAYNQLFEQDFVLVSDTHTFRTVDESQAAARRILFDPNDAFNRAFAPAAHYTLPSGEQLTLYARRFAPVEPGADPADYMQLLELFGDRLGPGDALVLTSPDQVYMLGLALPEAAGATLAPLPQPDALPGQTTAHLAELAATHDRLFLVSHNAEKADPAGDIEGWLRANLAAGADLWAGSIRVTPFVPLAATQTGPLTAATWPDGPELASAQQNATREGIEPTPGGAVVVQLDWGDAGSNPAKASLQLLDAAGQLLAQEDRAIAAGTQTYVLLVPRSANPGPLTLALAVYDPTTSQRLLLPDGSDLATLGTVTVQPAQPAPARELPALRHPDDLEGEGQ